MQPDFLFETLKVCKDKGIHTAIETHGFATPETFERIAEYTDLFLIDLKHMDPDLQKKVIGVNNDIIHKNIKNLLFKCNKKVILRVPLIPNFGDDEKNILMTAEFAKEIQSSGNLIMVNILPYHAMGQGKYELFDREYNMKDTKPPSQESLDEIINVFKNFDILVKQGG